jgi:hypothetical protein
VHPPADFRVTEYRDDIDQGVEWRLQAFRYTNALNGFRQVRTLVLIVLGKVRPKFSELHEWAQHAKDRVPDDLDHASGT